MELNLLLVCVGLVICFGGIYFRKICAGIMGLIWGALMGVVGVVVMALSSGGFWSLMNSLEDSSSIITIIIVALVVSVLSAWLDRLCAAINTFFSSFFVVLMICCVLAEDIDELSGIFLFSLIVTGCLAIVAYVYYNYAFILVTAFSGAYIASLGGVGLIAEGDLSDVLYSLFFDGNGEVVSIVMLSTIVIGCVGCCVQIMRFKQKPNPELSNYESEDVAGENSGLNQINDVAKKVVDGAKKVGESASPYLNDIGNQFKGTWEELSTEKGRNNLKDDVISNKILFIAPLLRFILIPIIYKLLNLVTYNTDIYHYMEIISLIVEGTAVGLLVYVVIAKDTKFNVIYQLPYLVGFLIFNLAWYFQSYPGFTIVVETFKFVITWFVLFIVSKSIKKYQIKPFILSIVAFFMYHFVTQWLAWPGVSFYINIYGIIELITCVLVVYVAFKKYHKINIFDFKTVSISSDEMTNRIEQQHTSAVYRCTTCHKLFEEEANFCDQCGSRVQKVCMQCGNEVNVNDIFCDQCGKRLSHIATEMPPNILGHSE